MMERHGLQDQISVHKTIELLYAKIFQIVKNLCSEPKQQNTTKVIISRIIRAVPEKRSIPCANNEHHPAVT